MHWLYQLSHRLPLFHFSSQEQEKSAQVSRRVNAISEVSENVKRVDELLENYRRHELSPADQETLQVNALSPAQMLFFLPLLEGASPVGVCRDRSVGVPRVLSNGTFPPQALLQRCEKLRPLLFRLASEAVADEEALGKSQHCPCASLQLGQGCAWAVGTLWAKLSTFTIKPGPGEVAWGLLLISEEAVNFCLEPKV